jgi:hypothetical protein
MWATEKEHGGLRPFKALKVMSSRYGELAVWISILKESMTDENRARSGYLGIVLKDFGVWQSM